VKLVIAALNVVLSFGILRLRLGYHKAADTARAVEQTADALKKRYTGDPSFSEVEAVRSYHTYQLARASAPLIPDSVYRWFRNDLNQRWDRRNAPPT